MRVLVTDGDNRAALAVTRSLGRLGHEVLVGERHRRSLAHGSRYCVERVEYPDPTTRSELFIEELSRIVSTHAVDVLMPVADISTFLIAGSRDRFACRVPLPPTHIIERAADKVDVMQTAARLGVPVPCGTVVRSLDTLRLDAVSFPIVIKPWRSRVRTADGWQAFSVSYASSRDELLRDLESRPDGAFPVLLQERIIGPGLGVFACFDQGRPVALFSHRRLRERPPWGGVSVLCESITLDPRASDYAVRLLAELGWQGPAMVEFKVDERDGLPKLMEINGRFWGSLQLAIDAGVDFPALALEAMHHGPFPEQPPYRVGVRSRWLWGDIDALMLRLRAGSRTLLPPSTPGRMASVLAFLTFWQRDLFYDNPKWDDPWPWVVETGTRVRAVPQRVGNLLRVATRSALPERDAAAHAARRPGEPAAGIRVDFAPTFAAVGLDEAGWDALLATSAVNSVFQTRQWNEAWWSAFGGPHAPLLATVSDERGIQALAPLFVHHRRGGERVARFIGDGRSDYCDVIAATGSNGAVSVMLDAIMDAGGWDVLELNNVPGHSSTPARVSEASARHGYHVIVSGQFDCPTLVIRGHEDQARAILRKPSLRRASHAFERIGRLTAIDLSTADEIEPHLEAFFEQHVARWAGRGPSLFTNPQNRLFYRRVTRAMSRTGWLTFSVIRLEDQMLACHFGFHYNGALLWYKPSFNIAYASKSPGLVLVHHLIERALALDCRELDFTVGAEPFKSRFTNTIRKTLKVRVFRNRARYLLARSHEILRSHARARLTVGSV